MFLALKARAAWDTNAWPSTNYARFSDTNMWVTVTNVYAKSWDRDLYATSSISFSGWVDGTNWTYDLVTNDSVQGTSLWATFSVEGGQASNYFNLTNYNTWLTDIREGYANHLSFSETNSVTNTYYITISAGVTNTVTEIDTQRGSGVRTNMYMNAKDIRAWDCYMAIEERAKFLADADRPETKFYRTERDNLYYFKLSLPIAVFIDRSLADTNGYFDTWFSNNQSEVSLPEWTVTGLLAHISTPTNYLTYTPYRSLNGSGYPYTRIMTGEYTMVVSPGGTNLGTNTVSGVYGDWTKDIVGTNGFVTNIPSTNLSIQTGFTMQDYGWKFMTNILNELVWYEDTIDSFQYTADSNTWYGSDSAATWADATNAAIADFKLVSDGTVAFPGEETSGYQDSITSNYTAWAYAALRFVRLNVNYTNRLPGIGFDVDAYVRFSVENVSGTATFDQNGDNVFSNRLVRIGSATNVSGVDVTGILTGNTNLPNFNPSVSGQDVTDFRGYRHSGVDGDPEAAVIKMNTTNGFDYQ